MVAEHTASIQCKNAPACLGWTEALS